MRVKKYLTVFENFGQPLYTIRFKNMYVASRKNKEEILKIYDECVEAGWDMEKLISIRDKYLRFRKRGDEHRYISKNISNKYVISRRKEYYCSVDTPEEAMKLRDLLEQNDWDKNLIPKEIRHRYGNTGLPKYIRKTRQGTYSIQKDRQTWGTFGKLEDAVEERDLLIKHNWDYDFVDLY